MPSLKGMYDPDVIQKMVEDRDEDNIKEETIGVAEQLATITEREYSADAGTVPFNKAFWKPKLIDLDLPIRVFKDTDWDEQARPMIPDPNPNWEWNREATEKLAAALYTNDTTLLFGNKGSGKSDLVKEWCAKFRIPFWRMNCHAETRETHFVGAVGITYDEQDRINIQQEPTHLTDSLKYGGIFCEDECFRHSSALVLQSLREKSSRFLVLPDAPNRSADERKLVAPFNQWWYVMTDNTTGLGDETGTFDAEVQDMSTLDRIDSVIEVDYLGKPQERKILSSYASHLNEQQVSCMLDFAKGIRRSFKRHELLDTISVRTLLNWADKVNIFGGIATALKVSWYDKLTDADKSIAKELYFQVFAEELK